MSENISTPETQNIPFASALALLGTALQSVAVTVEGASKMGLLLAESLSDTFAVARSIVSHISEALGEFAEIAQDFNYNEKLRTLKWPLYFEKDQRLIGFFASQNTEGQARLTSQKESEIANYVFICLDSEWLTKLQERWASSRFIESGRLLLLSEAISLYRSESFYGSTALLICQFYGIAMAVNKYVKEHSLVASAEDKELIKKTFTQIEIESEKGQTLQLFLNSQIGGFVWYYVAEYFHDEILCSSDSKARMKRQPMRNKICHGDQVNFGTREHALKAILCIDILIRLGDEFEYTVKLMSEKTA